MKNMNCKVVKPLCLAPSPVSFFCYKLSDCIGFLWKCFQSILNLHQSKTSSRGGFPWPCGVYECSTTYSEREGLR
jgi:hypothetical protein